MLDRIFQLLFSCNRTIAQGIVHITAPPFCTHCKLFLVKRAILCDVCKAKIRPVVSYKLAVTEEYSVSVFAISDYRGPIRSLILSKGHSNIAAARQLGILLWQMTDIRYQHFDYIIPVPLHWWRYAQRSYNQAAEIAYGLCTQVDTSVLHALTRVKSTMYQSTLSHDARAINVSQAFIVRTDMTEILRGARILLIDDLLTTGATVRSCVQELKKTKPASIVVAVASRVV